MRRGAHAPHTDADRPGSALGGTDLVVTDTDVVVTDADIVVTDAVDVAARADVAVLVTLAALARGANGPVPAGVIDEARELATHGDVFDAWDEPTPADPALRAAGEETTYRALLTPGRDAGAEPTTPAASPSSGPDGAEAGTPAAPRAHTSTSDTAAFLRLALRVWAADGSLVLTRGEPTPDVLAARLLAEGVTGHA